MSTLKEKFNSLVPKEFGGMQEPTLTGCEQITDDYAIEFLIFEHEAFSGKIMNYEYAKAMLKSFKKEKGY